MALAPNNPYALANLGACLVRSKSLQRAEELCRRSLSILPANQRAWAALAQACRGQKKLAEAQKACTRALKLNPQGPAADLCRAMLQRMK